MKELTHKLQFKGQLPVTVCGLYKGSLNVTINNNFVTCEDCKELI